MNLTVNRRAFTDELGIALRNAEKQQLIPILSHVLLTANGDLRIAATDHEMSYRSHIDADIGAEGAIALPARKLHDYVSQLSGEMLSLELAKDRCTVSAGKNKLRLAGLSGADFPALPEVGQERTATVKASDLYGALERCVIIPEKLAGNTDYRTAVFFSKALGKLKIFAIASHRMSECEIATDDAPAPKEYIAISERAAQEFLHLAKSATEGQDASLTWNDRQLALTLSERVLTAQRLSAQAPSIVTKGEIKRKYQHSCSFNAQDMRIAVGLAAICARDNAGINSVVLEIAEDGMNIRSASQENGDTEQYVFSKSDIAINLRFNAQYIQEMLALAESRKTTLSLIDGKTATRWEVSEDEYGWSYYLAPMVI